MKSKSKGPGSKLLLIFPCSRIPSRNSHLERAEQVFPLEIANVFLLYIPNSSNEWKFPASITQKEYSILSDSSPSALWKEQEEVTWACAWGSRGRAPNLPKRDKQNMGDLISYFNVFMTLHISFLNFHCRE